MAQTAATTKAQVYLAFDPVVASDQRHAAEDDHAQHGSGGQVLSIRNAPELPAYLPSQGQAAAAAVAGGAPSSSTSTGDEEDEAHKSKMKRKAEQRSQQYRAFVDKAVKSYARQTGQSASALWGRLKSFMNQHMASASAAADSARAGQNSAAGSVSGNVGRGKKVRSAALARLMQRFEQPQDSERKDDQEETKDAPQQDPDDAACAPPPALVEQHLSLWSPEQDRATTLEEEEQQTSKAEAYALQLYSQYGEYRQPVKTKDPDYFAYRGPTEENKTGGPDAAASALPAHQQQVTGVEVKHMERAWNEEYQAVKVQYAMGGSKDVVATAVRSIKRLLAEFEAFSVKVVTILVEDFKSTTPRIPPVDMGGHAGGEKFKFGTVLFKFARDWERIYGSDSAAQKAASQEVTCMDALQTTQVNLLTTLTAVITYGGHRVVATALAPIGRDSLVYGSVNAGQDIKHSNNNMNALVESAAQRLNLAEHELVDGAGCAHKLHMAVDVEGHEGKDGRLYMVDMARLMPPVMPRPGGPGSDYLTRFLRPEFIARYCRDQPLSCDAFSPFSYKACKELSPTQLFQGWGPHERRARLATELLHTVVIPLLASELDAEYGTEAYKSISVRLAFNNDLSRRFHAAGVNMRYLGEVWLLSHKESVQQLLLSEMILRAIKIIFRGWQRSAEFASRDMTHVDLAYEQLQSLYAQDDANTYVRQVLMPTLKMKYGPRVYKAVQDQVPGMCNPSDLGILRVLRSLNIEITGCDAFEIDRMWRKANGAAFLRLPEVAPRVLLAAKVKQVQFVETDAAVRLKMEEEELAMRLETLMTAGQDQAEDIVRAICGTLGVVLASSINGINTMQRVMDALAKVPHDSVQALFKQWLCAGLGTGTQSPLHLAARNSKSDVVQFLLEQGADANAKNSDGLTALDLVMNAPTHNADALGCMESLLEAGVERQVHVTPSTLQRSFWSAFLAHRVDLVSLFADCGANLNPADAFRPAGDVPLHNASGRGHAWNDVTLVLIEKGADVNAKDSDGRTPLHTARDVDTARLLIEKGADVNAKDNRGATPLHSTGDVDTARLLIEKGADVNAKNKDGDTLLHYNRSVDTARLLIEKGADVNAKNNWGSTPLHTARDVDTARLLIEKGADVNAKNKDGETPLHYNKSVDTARLLIEKGADVNAKNKDGRTPLHYNKSVDMARLLIEKGADVNARDKDGKTPLK